MVRCDEEDIAFLLAGLVNLADSLVGSSDPDNGGLVNTGVSNHIRGCKVVHDELELAFRHSLADLLCDARGTHFRCLIIGRNTLVGGNKILLLIPSLEREDLLNSSIEKKR